jgi:LPS-assembly protein
MVRRTVTPSPQGLRRALALWALVLASIAHADAPPCVARDPEVPTADGTKPGPDPARRIEVTSAGAEVDPAGAAHLEGPVVVRQGQRTLTARDAHYDINTDAFDAAGNVQYRDPTLFIGGDSARWSSQGGGHFEHAEFELPKRPARGHADAVDLDASGDLHLHRVQYTSCPSGQSDWVLNAQEIDIDRAAQQGTGHGVRIDFKGVPLVYLPVVSFPVGDARKSGFLFPDFGQSSRNGVQLAVPYYLNLAPNYDLTLTPGFMSKRGVSLGGDLRFLTDSSRGEFKSDWLPSDSSAHRDRSYLRFTDVTDIGANLRFDTNIASASDSNYFQDFGLGTEGTSVTYLERVARLTYLDAHWRAIGMVDQFQTIDQTIATIDRPYTRAPDLMVAGHWDVAPGLALGVDAEAVEFVRDTGIAGLRYGLDPTLQYTWRSPGAYLTPAVGLRSIRYSLRNNGAADASPSVSAPIATLDAGLNFEREAGSRLQTLEPRILYTYVPYRDQSAQPLFDTGLPDLNLIELFRSQRYVGGDRIADAHQVATGVTTRLLDTASGRQLLTATLGEIVYFSSPRVLLPNEPQTTRNTSDLVGQVTVSAFGHWNVDIGEQWNTQDHSTARSEVRLQYKPSADRVANLGYRYRAGLLEQVDGSVAWPVSDRWNVYAREVYSLRDKASIEALGGFEFKANCWRLRLMARHYVASRTGQRDTAISVQLELNGLSSVGERANAFLERSIRGYSPAQASAGP